jgi:hypothetical protein
MAKRRSTRPAPETAPLPGRSGSLPPRAWYPASTIAAKVEYSCRPRSGVFPQDVDSRERPCVVSCSVGRARDGECGIVGDLQRQFRARVRTPAAVTPLSGTNRTDGDGERRHGEEERTINRDKSSCSLDLLSTSLDLLFTASPRPAALRRRPGARSSPLPRGRRCLFRGPLSPGRCAWPAAASSIPARAAARSGGPRRSTT